MIPKRKLQLVVFYVYRGEESWKPVRKWQQLLTKYMGNLDNRISRKEWVFKVLRNYYQKLPQGPSSIPMTKEPSTSRYSHCDAVSLILPFPGSLLPFWTTLFKISCYHLSSTPILHENVNSMMLRIFVSFLQP